MQPFDDQTMAELRERAKQQLRKRLRSVRAVYPKAALAEAARRIVASVSARPEFQAAAGLGLFWPLLERGEVDIRALFELALVQGKRVYFPVMDRTAGDRIQTGFRLTESPQQLVPRGQRFCEPPADAPRAGRSDIDLLIVPALAVAESGHRLGYGSGFYDATLGDHRPPAVAIVVAYDFELLGELPTAAHDVACDLVITDKRVLEPRGSAPEPA